MLGKATLLLSGNVAASLLSLIRNLLIARLISVEDYGIAATFAIVMTLVEMASALGLQQQIIQAREGENTRYQAALQGFHVLRGIIAATVLFLTAGWVGAALNLPDLAWAYRVVALIPLISGFEHFDIHRLNRTMRFGPMVLVNTMPMVLTVAAVWPLVWLLGDWRVMLAIIVLQVVSRTIISHLVASRPYRIVLDAAQMRRSLAFGWPLLINSTLLFAVFQGDRLLVMREMGPVSLALFSMGVTLTLTPTLVMSKTLQNLFLPWLSSADDRDRFDRLAISALQASMLNAGVMLAGVYVFGPPLIELALGANYLPLIPYLAPLAVVQALRVLKTGGSVVALSRGHTNNAMISNIFRVSTLPIIWIVLQQGGGLPELILLGAIGEILGYIASLVLLRRRLGQRLTPLIVPLVALGFTALVTAAPWAPLSGASLPMRALLVFVLLAVQLAAMPAFRGWLRHRLIHHLNR